ncbi:hypothetical protein GASC598I20_004830 [Gilliamella apicola SCGC AB-598-I20]|nr:hypothetical protein SASC598O02_012050 [Snodgrassella alvi SCGC AB-598-O02]KES11578.1 hypothetical protein SASC598O02_003530 [Snodgrassella alvi SCGC AB-598-O02]KES15494.1 hypothetical protein GASC598I20_004830 [Gilliamella apicola SCGC AB-598-I20]
MAVTTFYKWQDKYGGMQSSDIKWLKQMEAENRKLKQIYAELSLTSQLQQKNNKKSYSADVSTLGVF